MQFNWGTSDAIFIETVQRETFVDRIYEKCFTVEEGDVVFDIGASIGVFTYSILDKYPKHVFCFEPSYSEFKTLVYNTRHAPVTCINKAISDHVGRFDSDQVFDDQGEATYCTTFSKIIEDYNISRIDFLKMDCEGGEYDIFTKENKPWILSNVKKIAGEWHLSNLNLKQKFKKFRDEYLHEIPNFKVYSLDGVDITGAVWSEEFLAYYTEIIIHIWSA